MDPTLRILIAIFLMSAAVASAAAMYRLKRELDADDESLTKTESAYTVEDYGADIRCDICFDDIGDERVSQCKCGKVFHLSCAEPTGECPYCGTPFSDFEEPREPRHVTCPRCGERMTSNICSCGTVVPDADGTFECGCGERIGIGEHMCRKCGRMYEKRIVKVNKRFIPHR